MRAEFFSCSRIVCCFGLSKSLPAKSAMVETTEQESLLKFPCMFSLKAMGLSVDDFDLLVVEIVNRHVPKLSEGAVKTRASKGGKYLSVTITFEASSKAQLDAIYQELSSNKRVLMSL